MDDVAAPQRSSTLGAWLLYGVQVLLGLAMSLVVLLVVLLDDSCDPTSTAPECEADHVGASVFAFWGVLLVLIVLVPIGIVLSRDRGGRVWAWPLLGIVAMLAVAAFFLVAI